jgi:hypothetical protein
MDHQQHSIQVQSENSIPSCSQMEGIDQMEYDEAQGVSRMYVQTTEMGDQFYQPEQNHLDPANFPNGPGS